MPCDKLRADEARSESDGRAGLHRGANIGVRDTPDPSAGHLNEVRSRYRKPKVRGEASRNRLSCQVYDALLTAGREFRE